MSHHNVIEEHLRQASQAINVAIQMHNAAQLPDSCLEESLAESHSKKLIRYAHQRVCEVSNKIEEAIASG